LEIPLPPAACTNSSTERVETPWTYASWIIAASAVSGHPAWLQKARKVVAAL